MSFLDENAPPRINVNAENRGPGSQYVNDRSGDQNVATGNGQVYKIHHQVNVNWWDPEANGLPSLFRLSQPQSPDGLENWPRGNWPHRPNRADMVAWLMRQSDQTPLNAHGHHSELLRQVAQSTGKWILYTEEFLAWNDALSPSRMLWMHGIRSSLIIDLLGRETKSRNDVACVYFYFQEGEGHHVSFARIWATLLKQLLRASGDLAEELKAKFDDSLQGSTRLYSSEYLELFKAQASTMKTVYLVIDALDSCQNMPEEETQKMMQSALRELQGNIRVLFTSRNDSVLVKLGANRKLAITPQPHDVETYVKKRIEDSEFLRIALKRDRDRDEVVKKVVEMTLTSNMFLLARLYMDNLSKRGTLSDIKSALGQLPDSEFEIFNASAGQIAHKINKGGNSFEGCLIKHIFTWVIHAKTELTAEQICDSFAIRKSHGQSYQGHRPGKELLMLACNGLVIMDPENETLNLVHKSVQRHLEKHGIISENANLEIAKTCLSCLLIDTRKREGEPSLLQYAAKYWWAHLRRQGEKVDSKAESLILKFLKDSPKLTRAFKAIEGIGNNAFERMTGLHVAVHFDLLSWAKRLLEAGIDVDAQCSDGQTALHWAVRYGRYDLLELLINNQADANKRDHAGNTPLHQAIMRSAGNDTNIAKALIRGNAQLDIKNNKGFSPMMWAICCGPTSIARIMVESQDNVDAEIFDGWTSLRLVFYHGMDIVDRGAVSQEGRAQLRHAATNHARFLTDVLLKRGVDLNNPSTKDGWTPLVHATKNHDLPNMSRLLMRKPNPANVNLQDKEGRPPLWWAVSYKSVAAIQLLVEHGANVNERYGDGSRPLLIAVKQKDSEIVQLLIRLGADVNSRTENGSTLLIEAIKLHDYDTVWVLVNVKAAIDARPNKNVSSKNIQDAFELAMTYDCLSLAWLLHEHGASPTITNDKGTTPLHQAAERGNYKAAQFLIERGGSVDVKDVRGSTPLHYAVLGEQDDLTSLLASRGQGLNIVDAKGNTALVLATLKKRPAGVRILLRCGASCNFACSGGLTALHHAAALGFNTGLDLMLDKRFAGNPNAADENHYTALHHAVTGGCGDPETVRTLVKAGANMEVRNKDGRTPLMLAAQLGREGLVRSLLSEGANAQARDNWGCTAASYATNFPGIQRLLDEVQQRRRW
ncbi:ankyrin repeat-containing domain protein [Hypoxylon sp. FL1857]|nr:ankyrin repeat-containing domain protein [Hypoxylon sp. FL1857]